VCGEPLETVTIHTYQPEIGSPTVGFEVCGSQDEDNPLAVRRDPSIGDAIHCEHVMYRERMGFGRNAASGAKHETES
jgi:hypothetical protein